MPHRKWRFREDGPLAPRKQLEQKLQEWYAMWLFSQDILFCASLGGRKCSIGLAVKMKRAGYRKGYPDMCIEEPRGKWHGMRVEIKYKTYPSQEQIEWSNALLKRNIYAVIMPATFDFNDAQNWLERETMAYLRGER